MDKSKERELLNILRSLSIIYEKRKEEEDDDIDSILLIINEYTLRFNFLYNSVGIVVSYNNNFNVFFLMFNEEENDDKEISVIDKMLSILDLPPNLIVNKLKQIGIQEV